MTTIKGNTKKGQAMIERAKHFEGHKLNEVYNNYSAAKFHAFCDCVLKCEAENGRNFHICSHNAQTFSVAWEVKNGMRLETAYNSYLILFPEFC